MVEPMLTDITNLSDISGVTTGEFCGMKSGEDLSPFFLKQDNTKNINWASNIPALCAEEPCLLGVDEAGRGPVLGPMVYGICYCPLSKTEDLKSIGCADSKVLTEKMREMIFEKLCTENEYIGWAVEAISPNVICNGMLRRTKISLNQIAQDSTVGLIRRALDSGANIREVYVDTVGPPEKYQERLLAIFPELKITVAKKADSIYPIVSAASICAKVSRDHVLKSWAFQEGMEIDLEKIGSGYPADPVTKRFLTENIDPVFGFPQLVRFSWSTSDKMLEEKAISVEWEDVEEDGNIPAKNTQITSFFKSSAVRKKHAFFSDRNLTNATSL